MNSQKRTENQWKMGVQKKKERKKEKRKGS